MNSHALTVVAIAFSLVGAPANAASQMECNAYMGGSLSPAASDFRDRIKSSWCSSRESPTDLGTAICFTVGDDGKIYEPSIQVSSSDPQFDAECLEAVCSLSPLAKRENETGDLGHLSIQLGRKGAPVPIHPAFTGAETLKFIKSLNLSENDHFVVVHKIPLSVLTRYPGMFSKDELLNEKNFVTMRFDTDAKPPEYVKKISDFYAQWGALFSQDSVTKDQILHRAKNLLLNNGVEKW